MMPRKLPKYIQAFVDSNGHARHYFRRKGYPLTTLPGLAWTPQFMAAYGEALQSSEELLAKAKGTKPRRDAQPVERVTKGSLAALIRHYKLAKFKELGEETQSFYTRLFVRLERSAGPLPVAKLTEADIQHMIDVRAAGHGIEAGNHLRRVFRLLMQFAKERGYRSDNPAANILKKKHPKGKRRGWATLSEDDIELYFKKWELGTPQHLAMTVLLWTGQRRKDIVALGPHSVIGGYTLANLKGRSIALIQSKTGKPLEIPLAPALADALTACKITADAPAFILTDKGKKRSFKAFTGQFTDWGRAAGIKGQCSPHTLRKAAARRLAEAGCTVHQIASITGHDSLEEIERYTKEAAQKGLGKIAIESLHRAKG